MKVRYSLRFALIAIALMCVLLTVLMTTLVPAVKSTRHTIRVTCASHGKAIYFNILAYKEKYGRFPPQTVLGPDGKPWHSWRVLLLEFENSALFQQYSFSEPWNGLNNRKLLSQMPSIYRCPTDRRSNAFFTSYVAVPPYDTDSYEDWPWQIIEARKDITWMSPLDDSKQKDSISIGHKHPTVVRKR